MAKMWWLALLVFPDHDISEGHDMPLPWNDDNTITFLERYENTHWGFWAFVAADSISPWQLFWDQPQDFDMHGSLHIHHFGGLWGVLPPLLPHSPQHLEQRFFWRKLRALRPELLFAHGLRCDQAEGCRWPLTSPSVAKISLLVPCVESTVVTSPLFLRTVARRLMSGSWFGFDRFWYHI